MTYWYLACPFQLFSCLYRNNNIPPHEMEHREEEEEEQRPPHVWIEDERRDLGRRVHPSPRVYRSTETEREKSGSRSMLDVARLS